MNLHIHIYDLDKMSEDGDDDECVAETLIEEKNVDPTEIYGDHDGTEYIQYMIDSEKIPGRMIEVRIPLEWLKPEFVKSIRDKWDAEALQYSDAYLEALGVEANRADFKGCDCCI